MSLLVLWLFFSQHCIQLHELNLKPFPSDGWFDQYFQFNMPHQWWSGNAKLEGGRCQVQTLVMLVALAIQSFSWFSPKLA